MNIERITAGYLPELPGLREDEVQWHVLPFERSGVRLEVSVPLLTGPQMHALAAHVRRAADRHLRAMPVAEIIDAIDRAIARLGRRDKDMADILVMVYSYGFSMARVARESGVGSRERVRYLLGSAEAWIDCALDFQKITS